MFTQTSTRNFAQTLRKRVLGSDLLDLLTGPHGVDRYTELVAPTWTLGEARAKVIDVRRTTPRSVTLTLAPNQTFTSTHTVKAGQADHHPATGTLVEVIRHQPAVVATDCQLEVGAAFGVGR
jgi:hypothetical protein